MDPWLQNSAGLSDDELEVAAARPYLTAQARSQVLRNAPRPLPSMPTDAVEAAPPQPRGGPLAPSRPDYRQKALEQMQQANDLATTMPDMTEQAARYRREYEGAGPDMGLAMFMGGVGGEMGKEMGGQILKNALARRQPEKTAYGTLDYEGFTADPMKARDFTVSRLETQAKIYEQMAHNAETVEQRAAAAKAADETKREIAKQTDETRRMFLASKGGGEKAHLQRAGVTPGGELVTFNPGTGQQMVNGQTYNGPVMSQATMDKQATAVQESLGAMRNLQSIDAMVAKNPNAFGGVASLSSLTPQLIASRWQSAKLTPQERETRALVMTQAAQVINDLYGAAVSSGEMGRAQAFTPTNLDDPASVAIKLKAAQAWASSKANTYGSQMRGVAEARSGGSGAGGPPPGAVQRLD